MTASEREDLIIYRLDELKEDIRSLHQEVCTWHEDHEQRIRALEHGRNGNGKNKREFYASLVALATAIVTLATVMIKLR